MNTTIKEDCPGGSLIFGMVWSGLSLYELVWVIHTHYCIQHPALKLVSTKYSQIKPNLKRAQAKFGKITYQSLVHGSLTSETHTS